VVHTRIGIIATLSVCLLAVASLAGAADLSQVLTRFDDVQRDVHSLRADFTMTTDSMLLKDALVSTGRIYLTKPDAVRWEFESPEQMRFVIAHDEYTGYFPEQKRAEKRNVQRWREHLFRFLGLGQASAELSKFYEITLADEQHQAVGTICLDLDPKKQRVKKRMDAVRFWIDDSTYMPVRVEYKSKKGDRRVIEFREMDVNPQLAADLYTVELPADVDVGRGFSAFSGFGGTATN
jgi:outer membrane lipoprotein-sorting protein